MIEQKIKFSQFDQLMPLADMLSSPYQRNKHPQEQIKRLAQIMKVHGVRHPIHISKRTNTICFGHGRREAALLNGWVSYPVVFQEFASEEEEYSCVQSDNAIAGWAELDYIKILDELSNFPTLDRELLGLKNLNLGFASPEPEDLDLTASRVEEVNKGDENSEWVGMPAFETGGKYINLTFQFKTELERELYCQAADIRIDKKNNGQWIVYK